MSQVCRGEDGELHANLLCAVNVTEQPGGTLPDMESVDEAVTLLKDWTQRDAGRFFLAVGFHKPHIPFRIPQVRRHSTYFLVSQNGCRETGVSFLMFLMIKKENQSSPGWWRRLISCWFLAAPVFILFFHLNFCLNLSCTTSDLWPKFHVKGNVWNA